MSSADLEYLAGLPFEFRLTDEAGRQVLFVHGTPQDCFAGIVAGMSAATLDQVVTKTGPDWLVVGHTHVPLVMRWRRTVIVNAGGVGFALDSNPLAAFALLDTSIGSACIRRVSYDVEATLTLARKRGFCFPMDEYRAALTTGEWIPKPWRERAIRDIVPQAEDHPIC